MVFRRLALRSAGFGVLALAVAGLAVSGLAVSGLAVSGRAAAGPADWQGAMEACLGQVDTVEATADCLGRLSEACAEEMIAEGNEAADAFCFGEEARAWDGRLNASWKVALDRAGQAGAGDALRAAQRSWIQWRDAECAAAGALATPDGVGPNVAASCLMRETMRRLIRLEEIAEGGY